MVITWVNTFFALHWAFVNVHEFINASSGTVVSMIITIDPIASHEDCKNEPEGLHVEETNGDGHHGGGLVRNSHAMLMLTK